MSDLNPERLPTGTLLEDLGCPHCGKTCDVCVTLDEIAAMDRKRIDALEKCIREVAGLMEGYQDPEVASASKLHRYARLLREAL